MASRSRWPSWILLGGVPAFSLRERLMGGLRCFRSRAEASPRHPPDQHRQPLAAPGRQIGPAPRSLLSLLPRHGASPSIEPARVGPRRPREVTHPTAGPLQRFLGGEMFDAVSQEWLVRFLEHRVADPRIIRLIRKWL